MYLKLSISIAQRGSLLCRQVQKTLASWSELPRGMCEAKLGTACVGQGFDGMVHLTVGLQQVKQHCACQCEMKHLARWKVASNKATCSQCLQGLTVTSRVSNSDQDTDLISSMLSNMRR